MNSGSARSSGAWAVSEPSTTIQVTRDRLGDASRRRDAVDGEHHVLAEHKGARASRPQAAGRLARR